MRCRCEMEHEVNEDTNMDVQEVMGDTATDHLNDSLRQTQGEEDEQDNEEEEETNKDENEEKSKDGEQGMEKGERVDKEERILINKDFSKEKEEVDTTGMDYEKGQEKDEDKGMKILPEVREVENGGRIFGLENKGIERLNRGVKARTKGGVDIQKVLKKQKIRRDALKERRKSGNGGSKTCFL
ncbi:glutamic acid-rich protein-like isoform X3 [Carassius gibelio]|nr:glutamic acid-rich protein-like isoform X3 [Carassius gibelio]